MQQLTNLGVHLVEGNKVVHVLEEHGRLDNVREGASCCRENALHVADDEVLQGAHIQRREKRVDVVVGMVVQGVRCEGHSEKRRLFLPIVHNTFSPSAPEWCRARAAGWRG